MSTQLTVQSGSSRETGRRYNAKGTDFSVDDSEYADDTAVLFTCRQEVVQYAPSLFNHFHRFGTEVHAGDLSQPDKPPKTEILFVAGPNSENHNLDRITLGDDKFIFQSQIRFVTLVPNYLETIVMKLMLYTE